METLMYQISWLSTKNPNILMTHGSRGKPYEAAKSLDLMTDCIKFHSSPFNSFKMPSPESHC